MDLALSWAARPNQSFPLLQLPSMMNSAKLGVLLLICHAVWAYTWRRYGVVRRVRWWWTKRPSPRPIIFGFHRPLHYRTNSWLGTKLIRTMKTMLQHQVPISLHRLPPPYVFLHVKCELYVSEITVVVEIPNHCLCVWLLAVSILPFPLNFLSRDHWRETTKHGLFDLKENNINKILIAAAKIYILFFLLKSPTWSNN